MGLTNLKSNLTTFQILMYSNIKNSRCCKICSNYKRLVFLHCIAQTKYEQLLIDQTGNLAQEKIRQLPVVHVIVITFYLPNCLGQETTKRPYQESLLHIKSIVSSHIIINNLHMMKWSTGY